MPLRVPVFGVPYHYDLSDFIVIQGESVKMKEETFDEGEGRWSFSGQVGEFDPPSNGLGGSNIYLEASNNTNCFGYWQTPATMVDLVHDSLYRARITLSSNLEDPSRAPGIRFRIFDNTRQQTDQFHLSSDKDGILSPGTEPKEYEFYFIPNEKTGRKLGFGFDLINMNPEDAADGRINLENIIIERRELDRLPDPQNMLHYAFEDDNEGWEFVTAPSVFTPAEGDYYFGRLYIKGVDDNTFGYWTNPPNDIILGEDKQLYCMEFSIKKNYDTDRTEVPRLRLRANALNRQAGVSKVIDSVDNAIMSPGDKPVTYKIYFMSPEDRLGNVIKNVPLQLSFDYINLSGDDDPEAVLKLEDVKVKVYPANTLP